MRYSVVISHHQSAYIPRFVRVLNNNVVFVFDDMQQEDVEQVCLAGARYVCNPVVGNRTMNRNLGLSELERITTLSNDDWIEFFDGDRVPIVYNIGENLSDFNVFLYICESDKRLEKLKPGPVNVNILCNPFYSCGFRIKYGLIKEIYRVNRGKLFDESFTGWGCEDQFLGVMCGSLGAKVCLCDTVVLSGKVGGDEISHPDYLGSLQHYIDRLRECNIFPHAK